MSKLVHAIERTVRRTVAAATAAMAAIVLYQLGLDPLPGLLHGIDVFGPTFAPLLVIAWLLLADTLDRSAAALRGHDQPPAPGWLELCVEASPMLGLLGTVIAVGAGLSTLDADSPELLVRSFGQALWSTALGLSLALLGEALKHAARAPRSFEGEIAG